MTFEEGAKMSFWNQYPNRKDWLEPYRGSKAIDGSCKNHGSCMYCRDNRLFASLRQRPADEEEQIEKRYEHSFIL